MEPMTKKDLATLAGYTYRRLHEIDLELPEERKLFVQADGGKYDAPVFVQRWVAYNVSLCQKEVESLDEIKAKHEAVKKEKTELEVAKMRGQLVDVQEIKRLWGDVVNTLKQNLLHIPARLAPRVRMMDNTQEIAAITDEEIRTVLVNVSNTPLPGYIATDEEGEDESNS